MTKNDYLAYLKSQSDHAVEWMLSRQLHTDGIWIPTAFIRLCKGRSSAALVLAQIAYWHDLSKKDDPRLRHFHDGHYWILKQDQEWEKELGLPSRTVGDNIAYLVSHQLIIAEVTLSPVHRNDNGQIERCRRIRLNWPIFLQKVYGIQLTEIAVEMDNDSITVMDNNVVTEIADLSITEMDNDSITLNTENLTENTTETSQSGPPASSFFVGDSSTYAPDPSRNGKKAPNTKGQIQKKAAAPAAISESVTRDPLVPKLSKVLAEELPPPPEWTDTHTYLYVTWLKKAPNKKLIVSAFDNADRIYRLLVKALPDTPLTPALAHEFYTWYYSQDWVLNKMAENKMADTPQEVVPLPGLDKLPKHLGDWLASRQVSAKPSTPVYVAPEVNPYERQQAGARVGVQHG